MTNFARLCEQVKSKLNIGSDIQSITNTRQHAAVALILRENLGNAELLVIKRAVRAGDHWSGNLALPGGRWQVEDANLLHTAIRETHEEIGIDLSLGGEVLGQLETLKPRNPLIPKVDVSPFIFSAPKAFHILKESESSPLLEINHEVAAAFWVSVDYLKTEGLSDEFRLFIGGEERRWPAYPSEHGPIWGMTERMLSDFLALLEE
ncbi:MAG: CoA pyrophosphatase [Acidobacteriota bacterium]